MFLRTLFLALLFVSCQSHYIGVQRVTIDQNSLASTFARSPDPLKEKPPLGEKLYVYWALPQNISLDGEEIVLSIIYRDLSEEVVRAPLKWRKGTQVFFVGGDKFKDSKGLFSYKAEIVDKQGKVIERWQEKMWVNLK